MRFNARISFESPSVQEEWQFKALQAQLHYLQQRSGFYHSLFKEHHINIKNIHSIHDLKFIPTTDHSDLQKHNWEFLCVESAAIKEYISTSGKFGEQAIITLTENDLQRLAYNDHQSLICTGGKQEDVYHLMLTLDGQLMHGITFYLGIRELGAASIRTAHLSTEMQWKRIFQLQSNTIIATPVSIIEMIDWAKKNAIDLNHTPVEKAICIGESIRQGDFDWNETGRKITSQWPINLFSTYTSTEMQTAFTECSAGLGFHEQPDLIITEILDDHGNPLKSGEYGEVTITTLGVEGMPLLRYRTGDICTFYDAQCSCGRRSKRLSPVSRKK